MIETVLLFHICVNKRSICRCVFMQCSYDEYYVKQRKSFLADIVLTLTLYIRSKSDISMGY